MDGMSEIRSTRCGATYIWLCESTHKVSPYPVLIIPISREHG